MQKLCKWINVVYKRLPKTKDVYWRRMARCEGAADYQSAEEEAAVIRNYGNRVGDVVFGGVLLQMDRVFSDFCVYVLP